jgi:hypothetical protein
MTTLTLKPGILLQSTFDKTGHEQKYDDVYFTKGNYTVRIPIKLNSGTTISGDEDAVINLIPKAPISTFPAMTPIFGQAEDTIKDITIENIKFDGNASRQIVSSGKGYHNFVGFDNASNITMRNLTVTDTQGDGGHFEDSSNINFYNNTILGCGHDAFYLIRSINSQAYNNIVYLRSNSALRCRGSKNVSFYNNGIYRTDDFSPAFSPGIQIENSNPNENSSNITISGNYIEGTLGPAIWIIGTGNNTPNVASGVNIKNNLIVNCGQMPKEANIYGVGGIISAGFDDVLIENNTIDNCKGYGIGFCVYAAKPSGTGLTATVKRNIISNTVQSFYKGTGSGSGVINLIPDKYMIDEAENCYYNNLMDYYNAKIINGMTKNPLYVGGGDFHLQSQSGHYTEGGYILDDQTSPCIFPHYELGCYDGLEHSNYHVTETNLSPNEIIGDSYAVIILCSSESEAMKLSEALTGSEYLEGEEKTIVYVPKPV